MKFFFTESNVSLVVEGGIEARKVLAENEGFDVQKLTCAEQVHGDRVEVVDEHLVGCGALDLESRIPQCDALVTNIQGVCLMMLTADCVPVLLYDKVKGVIAAIHAGWKGTAKRIVVKTMERMSAVYGCSAVDIEAYIGPCICGDCFEVGEEVVEGIGSQYRSGISKNGKPLLDLKYANAMQLAELGVQWENIRVSSSCTYHDNLPSWRRTKSLERIGSGIVL